MNALFRALSAALLGLGALHAQQNVGLSVGNVLSTTSGLHCGFDCSSVTNTGRVVGLVGRTVDVHLYGDANFPGAVAIAIGPAMTNCPGIPLPGIQNSLQILPPNIVAAIGVPALASGGRSCNASGAAMVIRGFRILAAASGATLTFQGLVFDRGAPTFTRPVELTVR